MSNSLSAEDILLLGYSSVEERKVAQGYQIFSAKTKVGPREITDVYIYLKSHCTRSEAEAAAIALKKLGNIASTYVLRPKSMSLKLDQVFSHTTVFYSPDDLVWDRLHEMFRSYINALKENIYVEPYYIRHRYIPQTGASPSQASPLEMEILDYLRKSSSQSTEGLLILRAPAGVGKTTLARHLTMQLVNILSSNKAIPVYVEASHWSTLKLETVEELWQVIDTSIRAYGPNVTLTEGLFLHALRQGYLVFIFDGFDELCGHRHSQFQPKEVLERLSTIASDSNAQILITTRTLFWQSHIDYEPEKSWIIDIEPFNTQQARGYFNKRFAKDLKKRDKSITLYNQLEKTNNPPVKGGARAKFVNLPVCVSMIADCVDREADFKFTLNDDTDIVSEIVYLLCDREKERQNLDTNAKGQLEAFEEIAVDQATTSDPEFDLTLLGAAGIEENDLPRLISHPLLRNNGNIYQFKYEFLPHYLKAKFLSEKLCNEDTDGRNIWAIMSAEANGKGPIFEHILLLTGAQLLEKIPKFIRQTPHNKPASKSFLFHLAKLLVSQTEISKAETTISLFSLVEGDSFLKERKVRKLYLVGQIDNLDFTGISFHECTFLDVSFVRCTANENTIFQKCKFIGELNIPENDQKYWQNVRIEDCEESNTSLLILGKMRGVEADSRHDYIKTSIGLALSKFWHNGRLKRSIKRSDWKRGGLKHSKYCDDILDAMLRVGLLEDIHISGVPEGGYLFSIQHVGNLQKFMDNRQITGKIRDVLVFLTK